jgi:NAD(P)-dependent dehydrogenase (short-subunit alcohol dehydrogenase family)
MSALSAAVVTGGGGDIGRAICRRLASDGWAVVVGDQNPDAARETSEAIAREGGTAVAEQVDVTDDAQIRDVLNRTADRFGGIGAMVNNAGIEGAVQPLPDYPEDVFAGVMRVNVHGVFIGMRAVLPLMRDAGAGAIVNTASTSAIRGRANLAGYVASKHAVLGLTRVAALETVGTGVRVNAVLPGPIETRMIQAINEGARALTPAGDQQSGDSGVKRSTTAAYGTVDDVAATIAYLVSADAGHVHGAAWVVDGGSTVA